MYALVSNYKKSIYEIGLSTGKETLIWDFYLTRSFASSASQKRAIADFGIKHIPFKELMISAGIADENCRILTCSSMKRSLQSLGLEIECKDADGNKIEKEIDVDIPRICCLHPFTVNEEYKIVPGGSQADCLFTHIRNSLAHGNTYFFENGNILLEDKDQRKISARILIPLQALIEWIKIIDAKHLVYPELATIDMIDNSQDVSGNEEWK